MLSTPTRMCVVCVLRRILDCMCGESVFRSLGGVIGSVQDMCGLRSRWFRVPGGWVWDSVFARGTEICDGRCHSVEEIVCILVENGRIEGRNPQVFLILCLWSQISVRERIWLERRLCRYVAGIWGQETYFVESRRCFWMLQECVWIE